MERHEKILRHISKTGKGLEIGPSYAPITPKAKGWNCDVMDHMDAEGLRNKYGPGVSHANIEDVDFVYSGQSYAELFQGKKYDWIIASHVIEHVPNFIGFLEECRGILNEGGVLSLAIPDMRFCFDCLRSVTDVGLIIDAHLNDAKRASVGRVYDYFSRAVLNQGGYLWSDETIEGLEFMNKPDFAPHAMHNALNAGHDYDIHNWTFTPASFKYILQSLNKLGFVSLYQLESFPSVHGEFFVTLCQEKNEDSYDEKALLIEMRQEIASIGKI